MGRAKKNKKVLNGQIGKPGQKEVRSDASVEPSDHLTICWHLGKFDWDGPWGDQACTNLDFRHLLNETVSKWETMTWAALYGAGGGRSNGNNSHPIETSKLSLKAKKRLQDIKLDDIESVVSLRVQNKVRFYGIRDGRAFQFLWYDPWHDVKEKAVCPSSK